jgi:hypothetical protein
MNYGTDPIFKILLKNINLIKITLVNLMKDNKNKINFNLNNNDFKQLNTLKKN